VGILIHQVVEIGYLPLQAWLIVNWQHFK